LLEIVDSNPPAAWDIGNLCEKEPPEFLSYIHIPAVQTLKWLSIEYHPPEMVQTPKLDLQGRPQLEACPTRLSLSPHSAALSQTHLHPCSY
jgi:hypothetical protein